jgi:phage/plasmid-associated DNA primase
MEPIIRKNPQFISESEKIKRLTAEDGNFYSNTGLFANNAPILWQHGLPVIPLRPRLKEPLMLNWTQYKEKMPTPQEQDHWLRNYPDCNIGLPLGPQSGCVAIDIDTSDPTLIDIIEKICGYSPWVRIGQKGKVLLYKYNGQKPFKIKDVDGHMICEMLSTGNQVVLPPSIHPNTQMPYKCNLPIVDALPALRQLPVEIETLLRNAFSDHGVVLSHSGWTRTTDYVSQGSRDVKMTSMSGFLANGVTRGELTLLEAIDRLHAWKSLCVENVAGDDIDIDKGVRNLIQFLIQDVTGPKNRPLPLGWDTGLTEEQRKQWGLDFADEHTEWSVNQLLAYLKGEFEKFEEEGSIQRLAAIDYVLRRISRSPHLNTLEVESIFNYIIQTNKKSVTKSSLKSRLKELELGELEGKDHTEIAKSVLNDLLRIGEIHFYQDNLWQYKGSNWEVMNKQEILQLIANNYGFYPAAKRASDHTGILQVIKALVPQQPLDARKLPGVNFANCFVDNEGIMHPHNKSFGCTYTMPFRYVPELADKHPMFDKFLYSIWGHCPDFTDRVQALREAMCATFFGMGPSFARAVLLYGLAGSGKSQLLEIVKHLLPAQVISYVTPYKFDDKYEVTELSRSLLNVCGELDENKPIPGASFKSVVDGSALQSCYKYGQMFSFSPRATHWFASNYLPKTRDASEGFNRRWLVFTFDRIVPKEEKVRDIGEIIVAEEREAIAAWVIGCVKDLTKRGDYLLPPTHREIMRSVACENDTVFFYLTSEEGPRKINADISPTRSSPVSVNSIYEKYSSFCYSTAHVRPVGLRIFLMRLTELGSFMGFSVNGLTVNGITLDKSVGDILCKDL